MTQKRVNLPTIQNVTPGATATLTVPIGPAYYEFGFDISGTGVDLADLQNIQLKIDGKPIQTFRDGNRVRDVNNYYRRGNWTAAQMILFMWRPEFTERVEREMFRLGTQGLQTVDVSFDIASDAPADIQVKAWAMKEDISEPPGLVTKVMQFNHSFATDGRHDIADIPYNGGNIPAIFMFSPLVTGYDLQVDQVIVQEMNAYQAQKFQGDRYRFIDTTLPDARKFLAVDFHLLGDPMDSLNTSGVSDLRLRPTSNAGSIDLLVEYIDGVGGM